jgi:hypothetical protein
MKMPHIGGCMAALVFLFVLFAPGAAMGTHSTGENPSNDFVRGTVHLPIPPFGTPFDQHVSAKSGPAGEDPEGHFYILDEPQNLDFRGRVTCLNVFGNMATIGGVVTNSREPLPPEGSGVLISVADNGEPGDLDQSTAAFGLPQPPLLCPPVFFAVVFGGGNYVVHDAVSP